MGIGHAIDCMRFFANDPRVQAAMALAEQRTAWLARGVSPADFSAAERQLRETFGLTDDNEVAEVFANICFQGT